MIKLDKKKSTARAMAAKRGCDQKVLQPVAVVLKPIEIGERRDSLFVFSAQPYSIGVEVPHQSHRSHRELGAVSFPMKVAHSVKKSVLVIHQSIHSIGSSVGLDEIVGHHEEDSFLTKFEYGFA